MSTRNDRICSDCGHLDSFHPDGKCTWPDCKCQIMATWLCKRESEIVRLWAQGYDHKDVARKLGIAVKTSEAHAFNIRKKVRLHRLVDVVLALVKDGQIQLSELPDLPVRIRLTEATNELQSTNSPVQRTLPTEPHCTGNTDGRPV